MADLTRIFRFPGGIGPTYFRISEEAIGPADDRVTVSKWGKTGCDRTRRFQVHDAAGVELFDTDDCYDAGNALHKVMSWLSAREDEYNARKAATPSEADIREALDFGKTAEQHLRQ